MTDTFAITTSTDADVIHPSQGKGWVYAGVGAGLAGITTAGMTGPLWLTIAAFALLKKN